MDHITITGIQCQGILGVYASEKDTPRSIIIDLIVPTNAMHAAQNDCLSETLDYANLVQSIQTWVTDSRFNLIETLAHYLADKLLETFTITELSLTVHKPAATASIQDVAITLHRKRNA